MQKQCVKTKYRGIKSVRDSQEELDELIIGDLEHLSEIRRFGSLLVWSTQRRVVKRMQDIPSDLREVTIQATPPQGHTMQRCEKW